MTKNCFLELVSQVGHVKECQQIVQEICGKYKQEIEKVNLKFDIEKCPDDMIYCFNRREIIHKDEEMAGQLILNVIDYESAGLVVSGSRPEDEKEDGSSSLAMNISNSKVEKDKMLGPIAFEYAAVHSNSMMATPQPTVLINTGLSWEVKVPIHYQLMMYGGPLMSNYRLDHYNAIWGGSEHVVDGQLMDGELQLFHHDIQYQDWTEAVMHENAVAVVSIMLKIDPVEHNAEIEKIGEILPQIKFKGQVAHTAEQVDLQNLLPMDREYLTYVGSIITSVIVENVVWMVLTSPIMVSKQAIDGMKELRDGGEESYKMTSNVRKMYALDREGFKPEEEGDEIMMVNNNGGFITPDLADLLDSY